MFSSAKFLSPIVTAGLPTPGPLAAGVAAGVLALVALELLDDVLLPQAARPTSSAITGWQNEQYNWQTSLALQQQLRPGVALNVGYFRTWHGNLLITDNLATTAADYDPFCVTAPANMHVMTWTVPAGGLENETLSPAPKEPLSDESRLPSGSTTVTIRSVVPA